MSSIVTIKSPLPPAAVIECGRPEISMTDPAVGIFNLAHLGVAGKRHLNNFQFGITATKRLLKKRVAHLYIESIVLDCM